MIMVLNIVLIDCIGCILIFSFPDFDVFRDFLANQIMGTNMCMDRQTNKKKWIYRPTIHHYGTLAKINARP